MQNRAADEEQVAAFRRREAMALSPEERLERAAALMAEAEEILRSSPDGYRRYLKHQYHSRRAEFRNGSYEPVDPARRALLP